MVDTHAHLGLCEPGDEELVAAAREAGVRRILTVGLEEESNREAIAHAEAHEEVFACVGRHPNSAAGFDDRAAREIEELAAHPRVAAVGETGLDLYRDRAPIEAQRDALSAQIEIAQRVRKPLVMHVRNRTDSRDPGDEAVRTLFERAEGVAVILHCFAASVYEVETAAEQGWYCSFAGNVSYPKAGDLRDAARRVPAELLLSETDCPYLAPQAYRGKPSQPAYVAATTEVLAEARGVSVEELERTIEQNAARVFGW